MLSYSVYLSVVNVASTHLYVCSSLSTGMLLLAVECGVDCVFIDMDYMTYMYGVNGLA